METRRSCKSQFRNDYAMLCCAVHCCQYVNLIDFDISVNVSLKRVKKAHGGLSCSTSRMI